MDILDGVEENPVGQVPETHGNRVIIDHDNDEFSVLSHLFCDPAFTNIRAV